MLVLLPIDTWLSMIVNFNVDLSSDIAIQVDWLYYCDIFNKHHIFPYVDPNMGSVIIYLVSFEELSIYPNNISPYQI
jgi:hypothetical protein